MTILPMRIGAFTVALSLVCTASQASDLVVSNWDGYMAPDAIEAFNSATGNSAELVLHATNEEAILSLMAATSTETFAFNHRSGDVDLMLWPENVSFAYVGHDVLSKHVAYGVDVGLGYSDANVNASRLK